MTTEKNYHRLAGWSGIIFVILSLIILVMVPPLPSLKTGEMDVVDYYVAFGNRILIGNYLAMFAAAPSFIFFSYLIKRIKEKDDTGWLWISVLSTLIIAHAFGAVDLLFFQVLGYAGSRANDVSIKIFSDLAMMGFGFFFLTQAAFAAYTSWALQKTKLFKPIYARLGWATAVTSFLASLGTMAPQGFWTIGGVMTTPGFLVFFIWIIALSLAFLKEK